LHLCHAQIQNQCCSGLLHVNEASVATLSGGYLSNSLKKISASRMP
jgi:hypothetical protein